MSVNEDCEVPQATTHKIEMGGVEVEGSLDADARTHAHPEKGRTGYSNCF